MRADPFIFIPFKPWQGASKIECVSRMVGRSFETSIHVGIFSPLWPFQPNIKVSETVRI